MSEYRRIVEEFESIEELIAYVRKEGNVRQLHLLKDIVCPSIVFTMPQSNDRIFNLDFEGLGTFLIVALQPEEAPDATIHSFGLLDLIREERRLAQEIASLERSTALKKDKEKPNGISGREEKC